MVQNTSVYDFRTHTIYLRNSLNWDCLHHCFDKPMVWSLTSLLVINVVSHRKIKRFCKINDIIYFIKHSIVGIQRLHTAMRHSVQYVTCLKPHIFTYSKQATLNWKANSKGNAIRLVVLKYYLISMAYYKVMHTMFVVRPGIHCS